MNVKDRQINTEGDKRSQGQAKIIVDTQ